jgi:hypothetical protein
MNILENKSYSIPEEPFVIAAIATIKCFSLGFEVKRGYCVGFTITILTPQLFWVHSSITHIQYSGKLETPKQLHQIS